jgi:hypothetical protein
VRLACAVALLTGCVQSHPPTLDAGLVDVGSNDSATDPSDVGDTCVPPTPPAVFDAFMTDLLAALAANPDPRLGGAERDYQPFRYARARVVSGDVVMDPSLASECVRRAAVMSWFEFVLTHPGEPCVEMFSPRCPAPEGTRCGASMDCDWELYCDSSPLVPTCQRSGRCVPRIPLGNPCTHPDSCVRPETGFHASTCQGIDMVAGTTRCRNEEFLEGDLGASCQTLTWNHEVVVVRACRPGLACLLERCVTIQPDHSVAEDAPCADTMECASDLWCDLGTGRCAPVSTLRCDDRLDSLNCPEGYVCVDGTCAATDGTDGTPCTLDCASGFGCHADGRCGDLLPLGAPSTAGSSCASGCSGYVSSAAESQCIPFGEPAPP